MKQILMIFAVATAFVFSVSGQNKTSMSEVLSPSPNDLSAAKNQGFEVFKILPRGMYDFERNELSLRGGGAYYSFTKKSHSYDEIPQIELQQNNLSVGFAGADYGMIADLGMISLSDLDSNHRSVNFLSNYQAKNLELEARNEYKKTQLGFEVDGLKFNKNLEAKVGHTYVLRAITYGEADSLVVFKVQHKDADGSLTIFWKPVKNFTAPVLIRDDQSGSTKEKFLDGNIVAKVQDALRAKGFTNVQVGESGKILVLRGTVPKGKMAEAIQTAQETTNRPIKNELYEK